MENMGLLLKFTFFSPTFYFFYEILNQVQNDGKGGLKWRNAFMCKLRKMVLQLNQIFGGKFAYNT